MMKTHKPSQLFIIGLLAAFPFGNSTALAVDKATAQKPALSANEVDNISERIRQTGDQMRADLKKARARFEAQEVERKEAAERARLQAIKDNEQRQAQKAAQAHQQQLAERPKPNATARKPSKSSCKPNAKNKWC